MSTNENDKIDLNKLSQKELLLRLNHEVGIIRRDLDEYKKEHDEYKRDYMNLKVRLVVLETKASIYGAVAGAAAAILIKFLT